MTAGWGAELRHRGLGRQRPADVRRRPEGSGSRNGRDPLDDLMSRQLPSGGFRWRDTDTTENALATLDSIRPLGGAGLHGRPARAGRRRAALARAAGGGRRHARSRSASWSTTASRCAPARCEARTGEPLRDGRSRPRPASASGATGAWTVAHRDDSDVVRAGDVISLPRDDRRGPPARRRVVDASSSGSSSEPRITGVVRARRPARDHDDRGAARIGVARRLGPAVPAGARERAARKARRRAVTALSHAARGRGCELRAGAGRYLIRRGQARGSW